jgi:hypothetical protein
MCDAFLGNEICFSFSYFFSFSLSSVLSMASRKQFTKEDYEDECPSVGSGSSSSSSSSVYEPSDGIRTSSYHPPSGSSSDSSYRPSSSASSRGGSRSGSSSDSSYRPSSSASSRGGSSSGSSSETDQLLKDIEFLCNEIEKQCEEQGIYCHKDFRYETIYSKWWETYQTFGTPEYLLKNKSMLEVKLAELLEQGVRALDSTYASMQEQQERLVNVGHALQRQKRGNRTNDDDVGSDEEGWQRAIEQSEKIKLRQQLEGNRTRVTGQGNITMGNNNVFLVRGSIMYNIPFNVSMPSQFNQSNVVAMDLDKKNESSEEENESDKECELNDDDTLTLTDTSSISTGEQIEILGSTGLWRFRIYKEPYVYDVLSPDNALDFDDFVVSVMNDIRDGRIRFKRSSARNREWSKVDYLTQGRYLRKRLLKTIALQLRHGTFENPYFEAV